MLNPLDKRKNKRLPITLNLFISELFSQDNVKVEDIDAKVEVIDVSKGGLGFISNSVLPLNFYFNAKLTLGEDNNVIYTVVKIIRAQILEDGSNQYGCEFVGLPDILLPVFEKYEAIIEQTN